MFGEFGNYAQLINLSSLYTYVDTNQKTWRERVTGGTGYLIIITQRLFLQIREESQQKSDGVVPQSVIP